MTTLLKNRSALTWAFDEVIDKKTEFEGNTRETARQEIIEIFDILIKSDIDKSFVTQSDLLQFKEIMENTYTYIPDNFEELIDKKIPLYLIAGWPGHAIFIFIEPSNFGYTVGFINTGEGAEIQGIDGDMCNGIITLKIMNIKNIKNFLASYKDFLNKSADDKEFSIYNKYIIFYHMFLNKLLDQQIDDINFKKYIEAISLQRSVINAYKVYLQYIGSCSFTNIINYMYYLKKNDYNLYLKWYSDCKLYIKKLLLEETKNREAFNIYQYILDTTKEKDTFDYNNKSIDEVKIIYESNKSTIETISRQNIFNQMKKAFSYLYGKITKTIPEKNIMEVVYNFYDGKDRKSVV